jgi:formate dehydrogenase
MAKVLVVLYPDPLDGYPPAYARDDIPTIDGYPGGQTVPSPSTIDFTPGELLGSVSGALGLRKFLEDTGNELVVTSDKDGADSVFERELPTADVVISQPFWPAYLDAERIEKAEKLKLVITAGIGSDHVDLDAAMRHDITVAEVTYSNSISVSKHAVMLILDLVRNFVPSHEWVTTRRGWNIADSVSRSYDLEGMDVGVMAAGRIGVAVMRRLKPFDVRLSYTDKRRLPAEVEQELGLTYYESAPELARNIDVLSIHAPLTHETYHLFDDALLATMRRGSYIVNTARAEIMERDAVVDALVSGRLAGYAGDVWYPQPPDENHPWRTMPNNAMTPHISGSSLSAQARYAAGTREILESFFDHTPIRPEYLIVDGGGLAGTGKESYSTDGSASPGSSGETA